MKIFTLLSFLVLMTLVSCKDATTDPTDPTGNTDPIVEFPEMFAHYPLDANANDIIGNLDGIVNNAQLSFDRFGNANSAYSLTGNDSYIRVPFADKFNFSSDFTMSLWIKTDMDNCKADGTHIDLISRYGDIGNNQANLYFGMTTSSCLECWTHDGNQHTWIGKENPLSSDWHHVALVFKNISFQKAEATIYLDGELYISGQLNVPQDSYYDTYFGSRPTGYANFAGSMDDIRVFTKALTDEEIKDVFDAK